ncbi:MAG: AbrB/MazE/SpoVT family DNA-binding domain-containing protein [Solirubrobacteraceae bacterium]|nr:AbrB/MazE/SpoVT family DNA-binding domain-containing protein [Patulibacter sp.]
MPRISDTNQVTLSLEALTAAHLQAGDEVTLVPDGRGRLIVERRRADRRSVARATPDRRSLATADDGEYPRDYLLVTTAARKRPAARTEAPAPV